MGGPAQAAQPTSHRFLSRPAKLVGTRLERRTARSSCSISVAPVRFYAADSEAGRRLLRDFGVDAGRLPAVIRHDGSVLHDPAFADVAAAPRDPDATLV